MNNYVKPGDVMTLTAPTGGVVTGLGYQIGKLFVVACGTAAEAAEFEGQVTGVCDLVKTTSQAWTEGQALYWDDSAKKVTSTAGANLHIGVAARVEESADAVGRVRLNGTSDVSSGAGNVTTADIAAAAVTAAKAAVFFSGEITATGSAQDVAHGLGVAPAGVHPSMTEHPGTPDTGAVDYAPGTHDATNIKFTATINTKWRFLAWA